MSDDVSTRLVDADGGSIMTARTTSDADAFARIMALRIGESFTVRGRTYVLAAYGGSGYADGFTVRVFRHGGGTREVRVRWDAHVTTGEVMGRQQDST